MNVPASAWAEAMAGNGRCRRSVDIVVNNHVDRF